MKHNQAEHTHHDDHHHHHSVNTYSRAFVLAILLNSLFVVVEFSYGFISNSTALIADAGHNLSDVLSLVLAWGASIMARKSPSAGYTFGLRKSSILAALVNAVMLLVACGAIGLEASQRFAQPPEVAGIVVTKIAGIGIVINGLSAWLFMRGGKDDINIRSAFLHMATDALVSLGVVIAGLLMTYQGWYWVDPAISLVVVAVIMVSTWGLLREAMQLALNAVPANIDLPAIEHYLRQYPGVTDFHDLHIWGISTTESALTVHLVMPEGFPGDHVLDDITQTLDNRFAIHHSTIQIEQGTTNHTCSLH